MKKSTIIIIIAVIVLVFIAGFIAVKMMNSNPKESTDPVTLKPQQENTAVETTDVATIDSTTQQIDTSTFSDTALNDLG